MILFSFVAMLAVFSRSWIEANTADCPNNWVEYGRSCYYFGHLASTFYDAENYCRQHSGHLIHVDDRYENAFIKDHLRRLKTNSWWTGLTDEDVEGVWRWYDTKSGTHFTDWTPGQPNSLTSRQDCVAFDSAHDFEWNDLSCTGNHFYPVCEKGLHTGNIIG